MVVDAGDTWVLQGHAIGVAAAERGMSRVRTCEVMQVALGMAIWVAASSVVSAQPMEVVDPVSLSQEVAQELERFIATVAAQDPELAAELERQQELCLRDLSDGQLDHESFVQEVEMFREAQHEVTSAMREEFDQAYQEALARGDTQMAEQMRAAFEAFEHGEAFQPTPEMLEMMRDEIAEWGAAHPEYAAYMPTEFEWGMVGPEIFGEQGMPEWGHEWGHMPEGMTPEDMAHFMEMYQEGMEMYHEAMELYRDYGTQLDNHADFVSGSIVVGGGTFTSHSHHDGITHDHIVHTHADGSTPHNLTQTEAASHL